MKKIFFLAIITIFMNCTSTKINPENSEPFFVGTYTNGDSKGIYQYEIDKNGFLKNNGLKAITKNPSFLAKTVDGKILIAVSELAENKSGYLKSFAIEKDTLIYKSTSKSGGENPCFVAVNHKNQVLVANYSGGNVGFLALNADGELSDLLFVQQHFGKGTTSRQEAPHAHSAWFHPKTNDVISVDLGTNQLWFSKIDARNKELVFTNQKTLNMAEAAGPRHLVFHPNKNWMYVLNELNNTISLVTNNNGNYSIKTTVSTLPKGYEKYTKAADIRVSNDGKFLYASNRGHNSIAIFKVNLQNGDLVLVGFEPVKGANPRNFSLTLDDKFLLVANQDSNNIVSFKRDVETGKLSFVNEIQAPNPVCILF
ncbi:MAG: lactonase family protein [Flavobacteriia bacterium]|nr:lactonase family protein [Flavobacteriia bacterium]NCT60851.1 lactonase family protein [Flavobacteriia bacterium]OIP48819.1 MAG: 6-phosphogluconolactonase [Flavobacteriaceae bacterium CG2_30_31_66]PIV96273.1 MAG: 6-phosphogluconolactonase [Flavobacteriaceae bacterium CG17_big_fil_post_rev_8_21_14_2_50_31_13]PIZ10693.1 MAG: 6-phosphogluconolactonase [Flavobacteriaceae bacterium CG_4_10_14_0_8_um_filter_31_99]